MTKLALRIEPAKNTKLNEKPSIIRNTHHEILNLNENSKNFRSKTLTVKNKNKIFQNFLSPSITTTYELRASKNGKIFDSKLHTRLIIEALLLRPSENLSSNVVIGIR